MSSFRLRTEPIGGSSLARAAQEGSTPAGWFAARPRSVEEWRERCRSVASEFAGGGWLDALAPAFDAQGAALARLQRVAGEGGVVVTTGQQPGLFGGPVYTWSKAIGALAMADALEEIGVPAAPVFWAATDDADFEEAATTTIATRGGVRELRIANPPPEWTPMSDAPLPELSAELEELAAAAGSAPFDEALSAAREAYRAGATVGGAYLLLLRRILEPHGVAVLDASNAATRAAMRPLLEAALERAEAVDAALEDRAAGIRAAGHEPQVDQVRGLSLVFAIEQGIKRRLRVGERPAAGHANVLTPNVLLRPIAERSILPTVAYLAGPGELAYFAQVSAAADAIGSARPLALPRWSVTIVEEHVDRLMRRLDVSEESLRDPHAAAGALARLALPASVERALSQLRETTESELARISADPEASSLLPQPALDGARRALEHRIARIERRFLAAVKRRETQLMTDLATVRGYLHPREQRQERVLNFLPILARQGPALLEAMRAEAHRYFLAMIDDSARPAPNPVPAVHA